MLYTKRSADRLALSRHGNEDGRAWLVKTPVSEATNIITVCEAATAGFRGRVDHSDHGNYVDDRALGRAIYTTEFIELVAVIIKNHLRIS